MIGVGFFLASPLALIILNRYGLQGTFLILGGINAHMCVIAIICKPSSVEQRLLDSKLNTAADQYNKHDTEEISEEETKFLRKDKNSDQLSKKEEMNENQIGNQDGKDAHENDIIQNGATSLIQTAHCSRKQYVGHKQNKFDEMEYRDLLVSEKCNDSGISSDTETEPVVVFEIQETLDSPCSNGTLNQPRSPNGDHDLKTRKGGSFSLHLVKDIRFIMFLCSSMSWNFTLSMCIMHLPNYMTLRQASMVEISAIMTCFTASNLAGRFIGEFEISIVSNIRLHCFSRYVIIFALT